MQSIILVNGDEENAAPNVNKTVSPKQTAKRGRKGTGASSVLRQKNDVVIQSQSKKAKVCDIVNDEPSNPVVYPVNSVSRFCRIRQQNKNIMR